MSGGDTELLYRIRGLRIDIFSCGKYIVFIKYCVSINVRVYINFPTKRFYPVIFFVFLSTLFSRFHSSDGLLSPL